MVNVLNGFGSPMGYGAGYGMPYGGPLTGPNGNAMGALGAMDPAMQQQLEQQAMQLMAAIAMAEALSMLANMAAQWGAFNGNNAGAAPGGGSAGGAGGAGRKHHGKGMRAHHFSGNRDPRAVHAQMNRDRAGGARGGSPAAGGAAPNVSGNQGSADRMVQLALAQNGDRYVFGAEVNLNDKNPNTFDCSELVQWAVAQAGGSIPDGSQNQRAWVAQHGKKLSVEQAIRTRGALLFNGHHVAISLGDGRTIEAMGSAYGVRIGRASPGRFQDGGLVPGLSY